MYCEYSAEAPVALPRENKRDDGALTKAHIVRFCCFVGLLTTTVELERGLEGNALLRGRGLRVRLLSSVERSHVGLVVLLVVKLHDLLGDEGLESIVRVGEVREDVGHGDEVGWRRWECRDGLFSCPTVFISSSSSHRPGAR